MSLDRHALIDNAASTELARLDDLMLLVNQGVEDERDDLYAQGGDEDDGIEFYADEAHALTEVDSLFTQLAIVGLYAVVEIRTKSHLGAKATPKELANAFKFAQTKALFAKYARRPLTKMPHYAAIDELRCLNNAVKHNAFVGKELARFSGWSLGDRIGDVRPIFARIRPLVPQYLSAVGHAIGV